MNITFLASIAARLKSIYDKLSTIASQSPSSLGQKSRANSLSVTQSTEDQVIQDSIDSSLTTIAGDTTSLDGKVTACNTGDVTVSSSALPSGAATSANQTTANTSLSTIAGDTTSIDDKLPASLGQKARAASLSVGLSTEDQATQDSIDSTLSTISTTLTSIDDVSADSLQIETTSVGTSATLINVVENVNQYQIFHQSESGILYFGDSDVDNTYPAIYNGDILEINGDNDFEIYGLADTGTITVFAISTIED